MIPSQYSVYSAKYVASCNVLLTKINLNSFDNNSSFSSARKNDRFRRTCSNAFSSTNIFSVVDAVFSGQCGTVQLQKDRGSDSLQSFCLNHVLYVSFVNPGEC